MCTIAPEGCGADGPGGVFSLWALLTCRGHVGRKRFAYGTLSGGQDTHPPDGMPCLGGR
jgi:hypothetical protein